MPHPSKYAAKTTEELTFNLADRFDCYSCGRVFIIDISHCESVTVPDQARMAAKIFCPYCGAIHRVII